MSLPEHVEEALARLESAELQIQALREERATPEKIHAWLCALSDHVLALADVHEFDREQIERSLRAICARLGLERVPAQRSRRDGSL